ncbi:hypothetical protein [Streptomyces capoamus]|nr:hypothetical protein [Streptomyces capoamus]
MRTTAPGAHRSGAVVRSRDSLTIEARLRCYLDLRQAISPAAPDEALASV